MDKGVSTVVGRSTWRYLAWLDQEIARLGKEYQALLQRSDSLRAQAALVGLAPWSRDSGRKRGQRSIRGGRAAVRHALYMAALSVIRQEGIHQCFYQGLRQRGKTGKVALEAVLPNLLSRFPGFAWPLIGSAIVGNDPRQRFLCESMLGKQPGSSRGQELEDDGENCVPILHLPEDTLFAWCHAHPERAPVFAAKTVPFLASNEDGKDCLSMHPVMIRLIEEFGDREDVTDAAVGTLLTKPRFVPEEGWWTTYHQLVTKLLGHANPKVRRWAKAVLRELQKWIEHARVRDAEVAARVES